MKASPEASLLPPAWQSSLSTQLEPGETPLVFFEPDLDERLFYATGIVVLTDRRLLAAAGSPPGANGAPASAADWKSWRLDPGLELRSGENKGVGTLDLVAPDGRVAHWRYTTGLAPLAHRLVQRFDSLRQTRAGLSTTALDTVCPSCGAVLSAQDGQCPSCTPQVIQPALSSLYRLVLFARPHFRLAALGFFLSAAGTAASMVPPYLTRPLIDDVLKPQQLNGNGDFRLVYWYLGGMLGAALLAWLLDWARLYVLARTSEHVSADLRGRTYTHLQKLSLEFFGGKRTGDLMSRVGNDTERICNFLSINLIDFAADVLMMSMTAIILLVVDWRLALVTICPFPLVVWLVYAVRGRLLRGFRRAGVAWSAMINVLADAIPGIRVVKAFAQERREVSRFQESNQAVFDSNDRVNVLWSFFGPSVSLLTTLGLLVVWFFASWQVFYNGLQIGVLVMFLAYITRFYARIEAMIRMVSATQRAAAASQRIFEILDRVPSVPEPARPVHPGHLQGRIELRGVRFKYGSREVLHGLDLKIEPGELIGLVGPSGAGKSTLINLICRFFDVAAGAILADGVDIRSYPVEEYRRNIGIVLQDPFLFYGTVAENVAYGKPGATRAEIIAAARAARAHEFILRLPDGYDSVVGERGQSLSGGERQRISIARALLIDPRILILDEATSSVDTETEREIQAALETLIQGRTTLAIAHRLSTLRRANRLVVLERGNIVEIGSHTELLELGGGYARLHHAQQELAREHAV